CTATVISRPRSFPRLRARCKYSNALSYSTCLRFGGRSAGRGRLAFPRVRRQTQEPRGVFTHQLAYRRLAQRALPGDDRVRAVGVQAFWVWKVRLIHQHTVAEDVDDRFGHQWALVVLDAAEHTPGLHVFERGHLKVAGHRVLHEAHLAG